jgi:hypothetical protein
MGIPATYRPDETSTEIFSEHTWLQGVFLACVAYGMVALLFFQCINLLLFSPGRQPSRWTHGLAWYITMMFALSTMYIGALVQFTQESFIDGRNIPGGPNAFENEMFSIPIDMLANVTMVILSWFSDLINASPFSLTFGGLAEWFFVRRFGGAMWYIRAPVSPALP